MFWNLYETGFERQRGDHARWEVQRQLILRERPTVLLVTEAWCWDLDGQALFEDTKRSLNMDGALFPAKTGCHQAVLWRPEVELVETDCYPHELVEWHGFGCAVLRLPGRTAPIRFVVAHLDPYSPLNRRIESDRLRGFIGPHALAQTLVALDANSIAPGDPEPDWSSVPAHRIGNHLMPGETVADRSPLGALLGAGSRPLLVDVAAHTGDRRPTYRTPTDGDPSRRIDLFLASPSLLPSIESYDQVTRPWEETGGLAASDHAAIRLRLRGPSSRG
ncbi:endonuclease/exonuclease/phosphatase family protein [Streptomyces sp. NPDC001811]